MLTVTAEFGTFVIRSHAAHQGTQPQTGEPVSIAASRVPSFKPAKALHDAVNEVQAEPVRCLPLAPPAPPCRTSRSRFPLAGLQNVCRREETGDFPIRHSCAPMRRHAWTLDLRAGSLYGRMQVLPCDSAARTCAGQILKTFPHRLRPPSSRVGLITHDSQSHCARDVRTGRWSSPASANDGQTGPEDLRTAAGLRFSRSAGCKPSYVSALRPVSEVVPCPAQHSAADCALPLDLPTEDRSKGRWAIAQQILSGPGGLA